MKNKEVKSIGRKNYEVVNSVVPGNLFPNRNPGEAVPIRSLPTITHYTLPQHLPEPAVFPCVEVPS